MTESEAIEQLKIQRTFTRGSNAKVEAIDMAIKALEKQEKIKEAFEMWKAETDGYYGADDETTRFISTLSQILKE